ncbi:HNH endonuclease [Pedobacter lithocola]|uniref:HNH endonuclease n=1 Tax=Pedobacter lithocola TaxID=1908239 RepID=A0ABV8PB68_9SPHI
MKEGQKLWTREELILAINLYCKIPFGRLHNSNPEIIKLANLIGRTASSVAYKLVNFASLDPSLKARGIKGASNASKLDAEIWNEFFNNWDVLPYESEKLLAKLQHKTIEQLNPIPEAELYREGKTKEQLVMVRVNQSFFRSSILASYNNTCCITGITQPELLVAGHIKPWSVDEKNRLNPQNGIAINALHDKAFETGLMTITLILKLKSRHRYLSKRNQSHLMNIFLTFMTSKSYFHQSFYLM